MLDPIWTGLAIRMAAAAGVVVLACLLVERTGPLAGAMIATLPVSAGPAYVFLAMEHGPAFVAASALGSLAALAATAVFVTTYTLLARRRHGLAVTLGSAFLAWGLAVAIVRPAATTLPFALALDVLVFAACYSLTRAARAAPPALRAASRHWDIPVRALAAMGLVGAVLVIGRVLGPAAAGIAALAPVVLGSLGLLLYPRLGGPGTATVLANTLPGLMGNAVAVAVLNQTAVGLGSLWSLLLALAICVVWNAGLLTIAGMQGRKAGLP
ncbi:hypothetical protein [Limobrevibacterium gyesilva]|uniref:Uncharacterized protein n=1 Tax=Limobrevibacterium gyesilva TaxID=2991712 RepID=A0AA41YMC0_9PROT|nr:hypothetical protein [Limobrevibacterium gyesilva]MCW3476541.1 hypothetical protein [Limobrevibacterium gyesilva]